MLRDWDTKDASASEHIQLLTGTRSYFRHPASTKRCFKKKSSVRLAFPSNAVPRYAKNATWRPKQDLPKHAHKPVYPPSTH